ncbi:Uncharacterised protein [Bordetella pertussis]|nr:Uncharacterised protein [Bordetella pertussis]CFP64755.1 Uncharacterised protein [Bordetella pertussis]
MTPAPVPTAPSSRAWRHSMVSTPAFRKTATAARQPKWVAM